MSDQDHGPPQATKGALALSDSLSVVRQVLAASSCTSVTKLIAVAANALTSHRDIDGCEVFVGTAAGVRHESSAGMRSSSDMPPMLEAWLLTEVFPLMVKSAQAQREPALHHRSESLHGCVLAVPIGKADETIGSLVVWNKSPNRFLPWHETLLQMVVEVLELVLRCPPAASRKTAGNETPECKSARTTATAVWHVPAEQNGSQTMDPLTGLADRVAFEHRLQALATVPMPSFQSCFVLYLDIDRFRLVREHGGYMTAERVIRLLAEVLQEQTGNELALARLGIDEFGVVIERRSLEQAVALADALVGQVDAFRMTFAGQRFDVSISIGVAQLDTRWGSASAVLRRAMQACRAAQSLGGGAVQVYHERLTRLSGAGNDMWMLNQLTHALKNNGLELHAQLIAPLRTESPTETALPGMHELLLRLRGDDGEIYNAGTFLPIAERYGLSAKLDRWVIETAFRQIARSPWATNTQHRFTLNLSGHSIDNHGLLDFVMQQFEATRLPSERICFEITETAAISDMVAAKEFVEALRRVGCEFALDDFGSGHSSFLYLRDLPVDYLKIDGALVRDIVNDPVSLAFVRTIQGIGKLMKRRTIAECVQSPDICSAIESIGCDYAQGYWIGCPVPLADVLSEAPDWCALGSSGS